MSELECGLLWEEMHPFPVIGMCHDPPMMSVQLDLHL